MKQALGFSKDARHPRPAPSRLFHGISIVFGKVAEAAVVVAVSVVVTRAANDGLDEKPRISIVRFEDRKSVERDGSDIHYFSLAHRRPDRTMDPFVLTIPAKGGRREAMPHEGRADFCTVWSADILSAVGPGDILSPGGQDVRST